MPAPKKISDEELHRAVDSGKTKVEIAEQFGVTPTAVAKRMKSLGRTVQQVAIVESAREIVKGKLDAIEQLTLINDHANEILDLLMRWNRGDESALQILESQVKRVRVGKGESAKLVTEYKMKDPRELALKAMAEIRGQLGLQLDIFKTLYDVEAVREFQNIVVEVVSEVDPGVRDEIVKRLKDRRAFRPDIIFD